MIGSDLLIYIAISWAEYLRPAKPKPTPSLLLLWCRADIIGAAGVVDVVPRHVKEERLHRDGLHLRWVRNQITEISVCSELVKTFNEWPLLGRTRFRIGTLQSNKSAVLSYQAPENSLQGADLHARDFKSWGTFGTGSGLWGSSTHQAQCLGIECKGFGGFAENAVGPSKGKTSRREDVSETA